MTSVCVCHWQTISFNSLKIVSNCRFLCEKLLCCKSSNRSNISIRINCCLPRVSIIGDSFWLSLSLPPLFRAHCSKCYFFSFQTKLFLSQNCIANRFSIFSNRLLFPFSALSTLPFSHYSFCCFNVTPSFFRFH